MSRPKRHIYADHHVHTVFRAANRAFLFVKKGAQTIWLQSLERAHLRFNATFYAWVGMSNHHHLLNKAPSHRYYPDPFSQIWKPARKITYGQFLSDTFSTFARKINQLLKRRSALVDDRSKTVHVTSDYQALNTLIYIFLNPVRAGMVGHPRDYPFSNFKHYAYGQDLHEDLFDLHPAYLALGSSPSIRQHRFLALVEKALKDWAHRHWQGASHANGCGHLKRMKALNQFRSCTDTWLKEALTQVRGPPANLLEVGLS